MLFKRGRSEPVGKRIGNWVWPRIGLKRSFQYLGYRLVRLDASSHSIAAGLAAGIAVSFTPFLGLHFISAFLLAFLTRGHLLASAIGTFIGNPWTFPLFFSLTGSIGSWILGEPVGETVVKLSWSAFKAAPTDYVLGLLPILKPFMLGAIPVCIIVWTIAYMIAKQIIDGYRMRKSARLKQANKQQKTASEPQEM